MPEVIPFPRPKGLQLSKAEFLAVYDQASPGQQHLLWLIALALTDLLPEAPSGPDGPLIQLCEALRDVNAAILAAYEAELTDDRPRDLVVGMLHAKRRELTRLIGSLPRPSTLEGARAASSINRPFDQEHCYT